MPSEKIQAGFRLLEEREISELNTIARLWRHEASGAELLSLVNDDENKVFGATFRTPPKDSTGVAHILEHSVLCGSEKYPVKEPFVELIKGSLKTFVNAFTYPDKTCYPVASANLQDFYNLIDVYLDAVFHPLIPEHVFRQEGWRLEPAPEEVPAPHGLMFKGVVFNEMKGAYSSPDSMLHEKAQQTLYPDTVYGLDSGGDPLHIPDLSYEAFKDFHRRYYHPSNTRFFFHGNDPEERRLEILDACIAPFGRLEVNSAIQAQEPFTAPREVVLPYPADPADPMDSADSTDVQERGRCMFVLSWLFPKPPNMEDALAWQMLETMLVGLPGAPLRKALLDSGLGEDLAGVGMESELLQSYFSTGLKGLAKDKAPAVQECILQTLEQLVQKGLPADLVEAAVNSLEFDLRENNTGRFPRGLHLMLRSLTQWLYDKNPLDALAFEAPLNAVKQRAFSGERYFEGLISGLLLENPHRVALLLEPDESFGMTLLQEEQQRIAAMAANMDAEQRQELARLAEELARLQQTPDSPEDLAKLPRLTLADLPPQNTPIPSEEFEVSKVPGLLHDLPTNGLLYLDLCFDLAPALEQRPILAFLAPLFSRALLEMGTRKRDYVEMSTLIARKTGGIDADPMAFARHGTPAAPTRLMLRSKATLDKAGELGDLLRELLCEASFADADRLGQLMQEELAGLEERIAPMGHRIAISRVAARQSQAALLNECFHGMSQLVFVRRLVQTMLRDPAPLQQALEDFRELVLHKAALLCNVTAPEASMPEILPVLEKLVGALPERAPKQKESGDLESRLGQEHASPQGAAYFLDARKEGLQIASRVNYVAKGARIYDSEHVFHGASMVGVRLLSTAWLWDKVRVQGGAYGAFCLLDRLSGALSMASYRDPNIQATLEAFDASARELSHMASDRAALESAIIGVIGDLDEHMLPDAKGFASLLRHLTGDNEDMRQRMREQVLGATAADLTPFVERLQEFAAKGHVCALGPKQALQEAADAQWRMSRLL